MPVLKVKVKRENTSYPIIIKQNAINGICKHIDLSRYSSIFCISDSNVAPVYLEKIKKIINEKYENIAYNSSVFKAGEKNKNIDTCLKIYEEMAKARFDRKGIVINIGGGVVTDMGGFIASTYQRGTDFLNISTSILGMVDASIGGKLGINIETLKNYIGLYNHPRIVIMDINTLKTLPQREFVSGFAEIIKHGIIKDEEYFNFVSSKKPREFTVKELTSIIEISCKIKSFCIENDERENGLRKILNFGHTVGHAIESIKLNTKKPLLHGEAIALGIVAESKISQLLGRISQKEFQKIENTLKAASLPTRISPIRYRDLEKKMLNDKKNFNKKLKWILIDEIGQATWDNEVPSSIVRKGIRYIFN